MRKTTAIIAALGLLAGLTACASGTSAAGCTPDFASGDASTVVKAVAATPSVNEDGTTGPTLTVTFPTPLHVAKSERTVLKSGTGSIAAGKGTPMLVGGEILNGTTGATIQSVSNSLITVGDKDLPASISKGLVCSVQGSRLALVGSPKDAHAGQAIDDSSIAADDSLVYVLDIQKVFLDQANGSNQLPAAGLPKVVTAPDGAVGITVPTTAPPKSRTVSVLKAGSGAKLKTDDYAIVKYTGVTWETKSTVFDSNWTTNVAVPWQLGSTSIPEGVSKALTGQRVGSQVLIYLPTKEAVVPDGTTIIPSKPLVYVVDILGVAN